MSCRPRRTTKKKKREKKSPESYMPELPKETDRTSKPKTLMDSLEEEEDELELWLKKEKEAREKWKELHPEVKHKESKIYPRDSCPPEYEEINNMLRYLKYGEEWDPWTYGMLGRPESDCVVVLSDILTKV